MLSGTTHSGDAEEPHQPEKPARPAEQDVSDPGQHRTYGEDDSFAIPLGDDPRRYLRRREGSRHHHLERTHFGVIQCESSRPQGQQHIDTVGESVVYKVSEPSDDEGSSRTRVIVVLGRVRISRHGCSNLCIVNQAGILRCPPRCPAVTFLPWRGSLQKMTPFPIY